MPTLSEHDDDPAPGGGKNGVWIAAAVVAVMAAFALLHILGVLGPGTHG